MQIKDTRSLSSKELLELRKKVVEVVVDKGLTQGQVGKIFGVSRYSVNTWVKIYRHRGKNALLQLAPRGRPKGANKLPPSQVEQIIRIITDHCPDQMKLPYYLWTREAVQELIKKQFDITLTYQTVALLLKTWGFTTQKPLSRSPERYPKKANKWLNEVYPAIKRKLKKEGAKIHWWDETELHINNVAECSTERKKKTAAISKTSISKKYYMISATTNHVKLNFMVISEPVTSLPLIKFLGQLVRSTNKKIFLIVDNGSVFQTSEVREWVQKNKEKIAVFYVPYY